MSDGMSDAAAEDRIYRRAVNAAYELREVMPKTSRGRWDAVVVECINDLLIDIEGYDWVLRLAKYADPYWTGDFSKETAELLFERAIQLRRALRDLTLGHRGWSPVLDSEVEFALSGSGYELHCRRRG